MCSLISNMWLAWLHPACLHPALCSCTGTRNSWSPGHNPAKRQPAAGTGAKADAPASGAQGASLRGRLQEAAASKRLSRCSGFAYSLVPTSTPARRPLLLVLSHAADPGCITTAPSSEPLPCQPQLRRSAPARVFADLSAVLQQAGFPAPAAPGNRHQVLLHRAGLSPASWKGQGRSLNPRVVSTPIQPLLHFAIFLRNGRTKTEVVVPQASQCCSS